jgi:hypothetical protein
MDAVRFLACTVLVKDIALIWSKGEIPDKTKVAKISKCVEVTIDGNEIVE